MISRGTVLRFQWLAILLAVATGGVLPDHRALAQADRPERRAGLSRPCPVHDPFLCYSTRAEQSRFEVHLADALDQGEYDVRTVKRFCAPAGINDALLEDPATHLTVYTLRGPHTPRRRFRVANQFGTFLFDTRRTETLMVPAGKSLEPAPPPGLPDPAGRGDHYRCLRVFPSPGATRRPEERTLQIEDQFGTRLAELTHVLKVCIPTDKNGEGIKNPTNVLTCYEVRATPDDAPGGVQATDQFTTRTIALRRAYELCVPSAVDCDDMNPCTLDRCERGACIHAPAPPGTVCRPAANECDVPEECVGTTCPTLDAMRPPGTPCTDDGNPCTADRCDGTPATCQHPPGNAGTPCRPSAGECDLPEACTGDSATCPPDAFKPSTTVCRGATGECDLPVRCTGTDPICPPAGSPRPPGTPCTDDGDVCTLDQCDGLSGVCQHPPGNAGTTCRPAGGVCDLPEACTGRSPGCPPDVKVPAGTVCRPGTGECDPAETCTGSSNACPANQVAPPGTPCERDGEPCTVDACDDQGVCHVQGTSNDPACGFCGDTATDPCRVTVAGRTYADLQEAVNAARDGATLAVRGVCRGPIVISGRTGLTLEGLPPTPLGCPADGLSPSQLTSTVRGTGDKEVLRISGSTNITVRYLNVVDGASAGVEVKNATSGVVHCNCVARNHEGVELHGGERHDVQQNLVARNVNDGIRLRPGTAPTRTDVVRQNLVEDNGGDGIDLEQTSDDTVSDNVVRGNGQDGIDIGDTTLTRVLRNLVAGNGTSPSADSGIEVEASNQNTIDANVITDNADGLTGVIRCRSGRGNTGSNVTPPCR